MSSKTKKKTKGKKQKTWQEEERWHSEKKKKKLQRWRKLRKLFADLPFRDTFLPETRKEHDWRTLFGSTTSHCDEAAVAELKKKKSESGTS